MGKKINIITLQNVHNYGSVLQALATQNIFESLGFEVKFYNYKRKEEKNIIFKFIATCKEQGIKGFMKCLVWLPSWIMEDKVFPKFIEALIHVIPQVVTDNEDFIKLGDTADIYCTGSDQTWNSGWNNGTLKPLFLDFVPEGKKRIAYAASFGKSALKDKEKVETKHLLEKYSFISVRENSGVNICKNLGLNAVQVLDPTLQMTGDYWRKLSKPVKYEKYCLLYQLNSNRAFDKFAIEFCKRKGLKLVRFCHRLDKMLLPADFHVAIPEVYDFISYIDHADFILTDSFHCTAFSANLNKQFLSFYPEYGGRIKSILELLHLENRHLADLYNMSYCNLSDIDYKEVNEVLNIERAKSINLLKDAVD